MKESKIENDVSRRALYELGVASLKLNLRGNNGWPDRLYLIPGGRPLLIEFKRPGEEPRPLQVHRHAQLKMLNYHVEVHDDQLEAFKAIAKALEAARVSEEGK